MDRIDRSLNGPCQQETLLAFSGIRAVCMMQLCFFLQVARQFAAPECWNFYSYKGVCNYVFYIKQYVLW
ncbi:hypothetical protein DXT69_21260 [Escherichia coli]|nr:hypothetical protein DXT69_21260 [Escherichia coli]